MRKRHSRTLAAANDCRLRRGWGDTIMSLATIATGAFLGGGAVYLMSKPGSEDRPLDVAVGAVWGGALGTALARIESNTLATRALVECEEGL